jgi:hypothetical protein
VGGERCSLLVFIRFREGIQHPRGIARSAERARCESPAAAAFLSWAGAGRPNGHNIAVVEARVRRDDGRDRLPVEPIAREVPDPLSAVIRARDVDLDVSLSRPEGATQPVVDAGDGAVDADTGAEAVAAVATVEEALEQQPATARAPDRAAHGPATAFRVVAMLTRVPVWSLRCPSAG